MRRRFLLAIVGVGLAISTYHLLELEELRTSLGSIPLSSGWLLALPVAIALQTCAHGLRALNSKHLLAVIRETHFEKHARGLALGYLFNALLPFRLGELVRAHAVGKSMSISRGVVLFSIVFERAVDGLILSTLSIATLLILQANLAITIVPALKLAGALAGVSLSAAVLVFVLYSQNRHLLLAIHRVTRLLNDRLRDRTRFLTWSTIYGMHLIFGSAKLVRFVLLSVVMWSLYLASLAFLIAQANVAPMPLQDVGASAAAYLTVSVPSGPAFLGTFHYLYSTIAQSALALPGIPIALSVLVWAVLTIPAALVGGWFLLVRGERQPAQRVDSPFDGLEHKLHRDVDMSAELSHFLDEFFSCKTISHALSRGEISGRFRVIKTFKGGSNASTLLVREGENVYVKKITLTQHAEKLRNQAAWIARHAHLASIPQLVDESSDADSYSFTLKYRDGFIPFFDYIHSEATESSKRVLTRLLEFMYGEIYRPQSVTNPGARLDTYLRDKVIGKVSDGASLSPVMARLVAEPHLDINGYRCLNIEQCVAIVRSRQDIRSDLEAFSDTTIHGDLTVDNILVNRESGEFLVVDPNDENAISDAVVDFGKLYQSLHSGYEFLCQLERASDDGASIRFEDRVSSKYQELFLFLQEEIRRLGGPVAMRTTLFHEAVHYCRMLTYRARINERSIAAFYGIAVLRMNEFLRQYGVSADGNDSTNQRTPNDLADSAA